MFPQWLFVYKGISISEYLIVLYNSDYLGADRADIAGHSGTTSELMTAL